MTKESDKLYHATTNEIEGGALRRQYKKTAAGGDKTVHAVFVSDNEQMAYAYALKSFHMLRCGYHEGRPLIIVYDREDFVKEFKGGTIYIFDKSDEFRQIKRADGTPTSEWIYEKRDLPIDENTAIKVTDIEQVLAKYADIFFLNKIAVPDGFNYPGDRPVKSREREYASVVETGLLGGVTGGLENYFARISELIEDGILTYENLEHKSAPVNPALEGVRNKPVPTPLEVHTRVMNAMQDPQYRHDFANAHSELTAPNYAKSTISSLLKADKKGSAMHRDKGFAEKVLEERDKATQKAKTTDPSSQR